MQESKPPCCLLYKELRMSLIESMRLLLQCLKEVASPGQLEDDVEAVSILKVLLSLHHMLVAPHEVCETDLTERHLAELNRARLLSLCELALVQHLDGEVSV